MIMNAQPTSALTYLVAGTTGSLGTLTYIPHRYPQVYTWVGRSNVCKVSRSRTQPNNSVAALGFKPGAPDPKTKALPTELFGQTNVHQTHTVCTYLRILKPQFRTAP